MGVNKCTATDGREDVPASAKLQTAKKLSLIRRLSPKAGKMEGIVAEIMDFIIQKTSLKMEGQRTSWWLPVPPWEDGGGGGETERATYRSGRRQMPAAISFALSGLVTIRQLVLIL